MQTRVLLLILFTFGLGEMSLAQVSSDRWDQADQKILRLQPKVFTNLPDNILKELKKRGCTIPQSYASAEPHNVIQGQFRLKGKTDWAVLCSTNKTSSILVFWGGDSRAVAEIAESLDKNWLQEIGGNKISYSRYLSSAAETFIMNHYYASGGFETPSPDHQGISDTFLEKGSTVHYWYDGKWLELMGSD